MITIYDNAVTSMVFNRWMDYLNISDATQDVVFWPKDLALRKIAEKRGKVEGEFISVWNASPQKSLERRHTPIATRGFVITSDSGDSFTVTATPINLMYEVTVWSLRKNALNQVIENYVWWEFKNPNMYLLVDEVISLDNDLYFGEIIDASPVSSEYSKGLYYVQTFPIKVNAWLLEKEYVELIESVKLKITDGLSTETDPIFLDVSLEGT